MASFPNGGEPPPPPVSLRNGVRCVPAPGVEVEEVLVAVGEQIGFGNISSASRMNKAVVIFVKEEEVANRLVINGIVVSGDFINVSPLVTPTTRITVSNVPPFINNDEIERGLVRYGKFASAIKMVPLRCKNAALKHVMSFRRQVFMFLNEPELDISFRVWHEGKAYMVYANSGSMKCFECGDVGHKRMACPHKAENSEETAGPSDAVDVANGSETAKQSHAGETSDAQIHSDKQTDVVVDYNGDDDNESTEKGEKSGVADQNKKAEVHGTVDGEVAGTSGCVEMYEGKEIRDDESVSDISEIGSQVLEDTYTLQEINNFLDATFGKVVEVTDFFPDTDKFIGSVLSLQKTVSYEALDKKKRFRLKKMITRLRKDKMNALKKVK